jgi:hypothetical protein
VRENRTNFRKRVLKTAQIVLSDKAPRLECSIRNLTQAGACLQLSTTYGLPVNRDVIIEGVRRPAARSGERRQKLELHSHRVEKGETRSGHNPPAYARWAAFSWIAASGFPGSM